jgi:hypothetical protein
MLLTEVKALPYIADDRLPETLPTTPKIRILFVAPKRRQRTWLTVLRSAVGTKSSVTWKTMCAVLILGTSVIGSQYVATRPAPAAKVCLPDYARYRWSGFHKMSSPLQLAHWLKKTPPKPALALN